MIVLTVNGERREVDEPMKLERFLEANDINPRLVAVAVNGTVLYHEEWPDVTLKGGDTVEIVRIVGGG
jgi:thiamine biosynthesis protein ThiS